MWVSTAVAQVLLLVQVVIGVVLLSDEAIEVSGLHTFYGFVGFLAVGLAYSYRTTLRGRLEIFYGLVGLFLMGIAARAMTSV